MPVEELAVVSRSSVVCSERESIQPAIIPHGDVAVGAGEQAEAGHIDFECAGERIDQREVVAGQQEQVEVAQVERSGRGIQLLDSGGASRIAGEQRRFRCRGGDATTRADVIFGNASAPS